MSDFWKRTTDEIEGEFECPLCGLPICSANIPDDIELLTDEKTAYHFDCLSDKFTFDLGIRYLKEQGLIKEYFEWFYGIDISDITPKLQRHFENGMRTESENDRRDTLWEFIVQEIEDYTGWLDA